MWRIILLLLASFAGVWFGKPAPSLKAPPVLAKNGTFPIAEHKSFVVVLYCYNQAVWCEKALRSIFEQDYDHYRVILIDDGSSDGAAELAKQFILDHNQTDKVILIRNETKIGKVASLYRAIDNCLDREIVLALDAKDWLLSPMVLTHLNAAYQNPDVWLTLSSSLDYPSYDPCSSGPLSYYAAIFKQIQLTDLLQAGRFLAHVDACLSPLVGLSAGHIAQLEQPLLFFNSAAPHFVPPPPEKTKEYKPLAHFPQSREKQMVDLLLFSSDRPLQLYACLESTQRYMTGLEHCTVLYSASDAHFASGYEQLKIAFPTVRFVLQRGDFKAKVEEIVFTSPSQYILFGVDEIIMKDFVDLKSCADLLEKTGAYGFYLHLGRCADNAPVSEELAAGVFAGDLQDANSLDMTLFKKERIKNQILKYKTKESLASGLAIEGAPKEAVGLYFERSKLVTVPMVLTDAELLSKFNQGLKIDIEPLYKVENSSPQIDYVPELVPR